MGYNSCLYFLLIPNFFVIMDYKFYLTKNPMIGFTCHLSHGSLSMPNVVKVYLKMRCQSTAQCSRDSLTLKLYLSFLFVLPSCFSQTQTYSELTTFSLVWIYMLGKFLEGKYVFPRVVLLVDRHSLIFPYIFIGYFLLCLEIGFVEPKIRFSVFLL